MMVMMIEIIKDDDNNADDGDEDGDDEDGDDDGAAADKVDDDYQDYIGGDDFDIYNDSLFLPPPSLSPSPTANLHASCHPFKPLFR